jgi:ABC-type uncharacterized transport system permease subunit
MVELHQIAAAIYLAAGVGALLGIVLPAPRMSRGAVWGLALGAAVHGVAFATLHRAEPTPALTDLPAAVSLMAWMGNLSLLALMWWLRITGLAAIAGPVSFIAVFFAALRLPHSSGAMVGSGSWPHAHVLLASAGLALLGLAGMAGLLFLIEYRRLKAKRPMSRRMRLPSLEALDRVNVASLAVGFPLLTIGVITGMMWLHQTTGSLWTGSAHETWSAVAWGIYAGLAAARFAGNQGSRQAAASALAGAAFLVFAVVGVGLIT